MVEYAWLVDEALNIDIADQIPDYRIMLSKTVGPKKKTKWTAYVMQILL